MESDSLPNSTSVECSAGEGFLRWLFDARASLAITTYQAGKVALVGLHGQQISLLMRQFDKPMGLAVSGNRLALACRHEVWQLANAAILAHDYLPEQRGRYDALYLPRLAHFTGDINGHDLAYTDEGLCLINSRFSCLSRLSADFSFVPVWKPPFVSEIVPEDRCHLNGLAVREGRPAFVTAHGTSDEVGGWRANKAVGGVVIDITSGEIVFASQAMPHSPRWHDGRLWWLNSGRGELCVANPGDRQPTVVTALPGYLRGLCLAGPIALVGMSQIRERHIFGGLPVQSRWPKLHCGVAVVDLRSGSELGRLEFTSGVHELYDVQLLRGVQRPMVLNLQREAARQAFTAPEFAYWLRPENRLDGSVAGTSSELPSA